MGESDAAFRGIPKGKTTFLIWRIEKMKVVPLSKDQYGSFYSGDSYIIYSQAERGSDNIGLNSEASEIKGSLDMHIHFWLGSESSQDEEGVAAYKTVELDDYLGGAPTQHRETQGSETNRFMSYFKSKGGVQYKKGGVASGFTHVEDEKIERLLQVKGKHHVRSTEVELSWGSFNDGDVFIVDLGKVQFVWNGKDASRTEKMKAMALSRSLRDDRGSGDIIVVDSGEEGAMTANEKKIFEQHLPLGSRQVKSASDGGQDEHVERQAAAAIKLYICSDEGGTLKIAEVKTGPLGKADLDNKDSFIIDNGPAGIWVWNGKQASKTERKEAMRNAVGFLKKKGYPNSTQVTRVADGGEPTEFKALFKTWPLPASSGKTYTVGKIAESKTVQTKFDASTLHANPQLAADTGMVDDGSGITKVWRVENFDLVEVDKNQYGQFYGGDCYVVLYTYRANTRESYIIYYWQGLKSTADEKGTSALKAVELDDGLGGAPVQVRVVQGKEPAHFMAIFGGSMIIYSGGKAGWSSHEQDEGPGDRYLLQVRGTSKLNTKAIQVKCRGASLNSNDVFVLFTKSSVFIWSGKGSTGDEREMAKVVAKHSPRDPEMMFEGQEKESFWEAIGGQEEYASDKRLADVANDSPPRLFQCSNASGQFSVDNIPDFNQTDLVTDDVMLLDTPDMIFVWVGEGANAIEKDNAEATALDYVKSDPSGRDPDTPVVKIKQGFEPPNFTGFFGVWDRDIWSKGKTFEQLKKELGEGNVGATTVEEKTNGEQNFSDVTKHPIEKLTRAIEMLPQGVNPSAREVHLSQADFQKAFGMTYEDFATKPTWKQQQLKRSLKLF